MSISPELISRYGLDHTPHKLIEVVGTTWLVTLTRYPTPKPLGAARTPLPSHVQEVRESAAAIAGKPAVLICKASPEDLQYIAPNNPQLLQDADLSPELAVAVEASARLNGGPEEHWQDAYDNVRRMLGVV